MLALFRHFCKLKLNPVLATMLARTTWHTEMLTIHGSPDCSQLYRPGFQAKLSFACRRVFTCARMPVARPRQKDLPAAGPWLIQNALVPRILFFCHWIYGHIVKPGEEK